MGDTPMHALVKTSGPCQETSSVLIHFIFDTVTLIEPGAYWLPTLAGQLTIPTLPLWTFCICLPEVGLQACFATPGFLHRWQKSKLPSSYLNPWTIFPGPAIYHRTSTLTPIRLEDIYKMNLYLSILKRGYIWFSSNKTNKTLSMLVGWPCLGKWNLLSFSVLSCEIHIL